MTQRFHGIKLAAGSSIENAAFERLAATPASLVHGRVWYNTTDNTFNYSALNAQGAVVVHSFATQAGLIAAVDALNAAIAAEASRAQAAEATLTSAVAAEATRAQAAEATLTSAVNAEATRAQGAEAALDGRVTAVEGSMIKKDGSVAFTADQSMNGNKLTNVANPVDNGDAANKGFVIAQIAALGNAFEYVGTVEGGADAASALDLATLQKKDAGDYYKVTTAGYFKVGNGAAFYVNAKDGLIWNIGGGVDKIDNTDSEVAGTTNFVKVTGSTDTGFVVDIEDNFKGRVSTLESGLSAEVTRAQAAEGTLTSNLNAEVARAQAAEGVLTTAVAAEQTRAEAAEATLTTNLAAEVTRAQGAEAALTTNLAAEVTRATGAEAALSAAVSAEQTRAQGAEATLTSAVAAEVTRATGAEANLQTQIDALEAAAGEGANALKTDLNATRFTYKSSAPALVHTISHNMNSEFVGFNMWIQDGNGVWRNDVAPVEEISLNAFTVTLSEAANVKVVGQAYDQLA